MDAPLEYNPPCTPRATLILLHGLGATGDDLFPLAGNLCGGEMRVVCPHAPHRAVSINGGLQMPAWYDIAGGDLENRHDETGIRESAAAIDQMIIDQYAHSAPHNIFLGGFSQGAAMSLFAGMRHSERLAGIIVISGYMLLPETLSVESAPANRETKIFQAHGMYDPVVLPEWAHQCRDILQKDGRLLEYQEYPVAHGIHPQAIHDLNKWMETILSE